MRVVILSAAIALFSIVPALAEADLKAGKKVFKKCKSCHMVGEKAKNKVGPHLNNIFGTAAAANEKFAKKYSKNMKAAGADGLVWTDETMDEFLAKPKEMIKKTKMSFKGLKKEKDRVNVIAYIKTFSPDYVPAEPKSD